jgi:hypothetical protein
MLAPNVIIGLSSIFAVLIFIYVRETLKRRKERAETKRKILNTYSWIKVPKYKDDPSKSWEERYRMLHEHHVMETEFLIEKIREYERIDNQ